MAKRVAPLFLPSWFNSGQKPSSERHGSIGRSPSADSGLYAHPYVLKSQTSVNTEEDQSLKDASKLRRHTIISLWKWELLCLFVGILSFTAIIITLRVYQNSVVSAATWKLPISINAIIAILSALFKGCLAMPATEGNQYFLCQVPGMNSGVDVTIATAFDIESEVVSLLGPTILTRRFLCFPHRLVPFTNYPARCFRYQPVEMDLVFSESAQP